MRNFVGTSGFSYKEWKGTFYPEDLADKQMLQFYAERLRAVEINNTFYRMPQQALLSGWCEKVPESFRFILKASQKITHSGRLGDLEALAYFLKTSLVMGEKRGPILFQLPPFFRKDTAKLATFLQALAPGVLAAFEFRHPTWFDAEVFNLLKDHGAALCGGDVDEEGRSPPLERTADWGYLRLRRSEYEPGAIENWATRIKQLGWQDVFIFFKHETQGPALALQLSQLLEQP